MTKVYFDEGPLHPREENGNLLRVEHEVSNFGVERDSDEVGLTLELGQVVVLVLNENLKARVIKLFFCVIDATA